VPQSFSEKQKSKDAGNQKFKKTKRKKKKNTRKIALPSFLATRVEEK
jgi:hypothetical protein